jgi:hypothetical protein
LKPLHRLLTEDGTLLSENIFKPYPKDSTGLEVPNLQVMSVSKLTYAEGVTSSVYKSTFQVDLQTDEVAQYVWLEAIGNVLFFSLGSFINDVTKN